MEGRTLSVSLDAPSNGVTLARSRLVEVETAIPTAAGKWLFYTEALMPDALVNVDVPFFFYGDNPRVSWPALGSLVPVTGYVSSLPMSKERAADKEDFGKGARGGYVVTASFTDTKSGAAYGSAAITVKPGEGRDRVLAFSKPVMLPEGATVKYSLSATAKNGKAWTASGTAQVWTAAPAYPAGFQPVSLSLEDDLEPAEK